ncbi:hypothetical protein SBF1_2420016 [Candidatus Desulfosporosinus infrequens]|uniref:Uncharacterized protein n=1 Tax=Candidatus Desulfosporosinus infrequens TaxID=2043169 RepID=A0A2U3KN84_9FIRM|nr:hypothetical protein SBF1_2420016 [Candidatus Desulfosporosinus infrequens]
MFLKMYHPAPPHTITRHHGFANKAPHKSTTVPGARGARAARPLAYVINFRAI